MKTRQRAGIYFQKREGTKTEQKIRAHIAVESMHFESENGWWCYLKPGWIDGEALTVGIREDTLTQILYRLKHFVRRKKEGDPN